MKSRRELCIRYRVYTAAIADREVELAPWRARFHIRRCAECRREVARQRALASRVREALVPAVSSAPSRRVHRALPWFAAAMAGVAAVAVAGLILLSRQDFVPAAVNAAAQPPTLHTADALTVDSWCQASAVAAPPALSLPSLRIEGARMDSGAGGMMITIYYAAGHGQNLTVTWVTASPAASQGLETGTREVDDRTVLVVHGRSAEAAVITGTAPPDDLRRTAAAIGPAL